MTTRRHAGHRGTGPGAITPDGCSVELYARLGPRDEPDIIQSAIPEQSNILELGSGAGRLTHPLIGRGFTVTAVDESPEMLERVRGARTLCSSIEVLQLGERFDVVLLASFLINTSESAARRRMLRTCRDHVTDDGSVLIQREGADWHTQVPRERVDPSGYTMRIASEPLGDGVYRARAEYVFPDVTWTQTFRSRPLAKEELAECLAEAGLAVESYLTADATWVRARPVS
ncbi:class I SAM-dependent methyltransferase [Streptomyces sp. NPDC059256]|uniref:class I SAM-dependent methyltransferase n=1 Tax=Streptomyces sp. NPDC059256 TaxID=3346794 RepID=UPI003683418D